MTSRIGRNRLFILIISIIIASANTIAEDLLAPPADRNAKASITPPTGRDAKDFIRPDGTFDLDAVRRSGYQGPLDLSGLDIRLDPTTGAPIANSAGDKSSQDHPDDIYWDNSISPCIPGVQGEVYTTAVFAGKLIVGGRFSFTGCLPVNNIAAWDGSSWSALGSGVAGSYPTVGSLTVYNGKLIAGGNFETAGGVSANNIASWDGSSWSALGSGMNGAVSDLTVFNARLVAGGGFTTAGSVSANNIASWNGSSWSALGSGLNGGLGVRALAVFNTRLIAGGDFWHTGSGVPVNNIASWNGSSWSALGVGLSGAVNALAVFNSKLIAGGAFSTTGSDFNGLRVNCIASWDGSDWAAMGAGIGGFSVNALTVFDNKLFVGGSFNSVGGGLFAESIASWDGSNWSALGNGGELVNSTVYALDLFDNTLIIGGIFERVGRIGAMHIATWNGSTWSSLQGGGINSDVYDLTSYDGKLIVGGLFSLVDGVVTNYIASWDGSEWSALGSGMGGSYPAVYALTVFNNRLIAGGKFTTAGGGAANHIASWDGSSWSALGSGMGGTYPAVSALTVFNNRLIAGGSFSTAGGVSANNLASWDGSNWSALGSGMGGTYPAVSALTVFNNRLIAGGNFATAGGVSVGNIASWDGSSWSALDSGMGGTYPSVSALTLFSGKLIAGGGFTTAGGVAANHIASWDGSSWSALGSGAAGSYPTVGSLTVYNGKLIAGGNFETAGGVSANNIASWDGSSWSALGSGINSTPSAMAYFDGRLAVGGHFTLAGNKGVAYLAQWTKWTDTRSLMLYDVGNPPRVIANREYKLFRVVPGNSEQLIKQGSTDALGAIPISSGELAVNDRFRVEIIAHTLRSQKGFHHEVDSIAHQIFLDNANINTTGELEYDQFQGVDGQRVNLSHTLIKYNLMIAVEWDVDSAILMNIAGAFGKVANYMYDVTDGQATLGSVAIYDAAEYAPFLMDSSDVLIVRRSAVTGEGVAANNPGGGYLGTPTPPYFCDSGKVILPRCIYTNHIRGNATLCNQHKINWLMPSATYQTLTSYYPGVQGIMHELGHYLFYAYDEYVARIEDPEITPGAPDCPDHLTRYDFNLMDEPLNNIPSSAGFGDMSCNNDYDLAGSHNTTQWCYWNTSCWGHFERTYEVDTWYGRSDCWNTATFPFVNIISPDDRPNRRPLAGPNADLDHPQVNCSAAVVVIITDTDIAADFNTITRVYRLDKQAAVDSSLLHIQTYCPTLGKMCDQGFADDEGVLVLLGVHSDDTIFSYSMAADSTGGQQEYLFAKSPVGAPTISDTVELPLQVISDPKPLAVMINATAGQSINIRAEYETAFANTPGVSLSSRDGVQYNGPMTNVNSAYETAETVLSGRSGDILLQINDDSSGEYAVPVTYQWTLSSGNSRIRQASSSSGRGRFFLDTMMLQLDAVVIGEYEYGLPSSGLPSGAINISPAVTVSGYPLLSTYPGANYLSISYNGSQINNPDPWKIITFRWDSGLHEWVESPCDVDTALSVLVTPTIQPGLYSVFYLSNLAPPCGDANGDKSINIGDAVFLINHVFKSGPAPNPQCTGNSNGDGSVNVGDAVYLINHVFKGGPAPSQNCCP